MNVSLEESLKAFFYYAYNRASVVREICCDFEAGNAMF